MNRKIRVGDVFEVKGYNIWFIVTEGGHIRVAEEAVHADKKYSVFYSRNPHDRGTVRGAYEYLGNCLD